MREDLEGGGRTDETDQWNAAAIMNAYQTVAPDSKLLFSAEDDASLRFCCQILLQVAVGC